jgi:hypothetical protein
VHDVAWASAIEQLAVQLPDFPLCRLEGAARDYFWLAQNTSLRRDRLEQIIEEATLRGAPEIIKRAGVQRPGARPERFKRGSSGLR